MTKKNFNIEIPIEYARNIHKVLENHTSMGYSIVSREIKENVSEEAYDFHPLIKYTKFTETSLEALDCFICDDFVTYYKNEFECFECGARIGQGFGKILKRSMLNELMELCVKHLNWIKETILKNSLCYNEVLKSINKEICFYEELKKDKQKLRNWALLNKNSDNKRIKFVCMEVLRLKV